MASLPRVRPVCTLYTNLTRAIRPNRATILRTWRPLTLASYPSWKQQEWSRNVRPTAHHPSPAALRWSSTSSLTLPQLEEQVLSVLKMFDKVKPEKVTLEAHFINDLGMDSLDAVEVVMAFEDEFGCEITDEEAEKIFTCQDAVELLKTKLDVH